MSLQQPNDSVDALNAFHDAVMIRVGDFEYADPTHPGHDFFNDEAKPAPKAGLLIAFGRRILGG